MSLTAVLLILLSTFTHAAWNMLGKRDRPSAVFFLAANTAGALALTPLLIIFSEYLTRFSGTVILYLGLTGFFQALYFFSLAKAYQNGELSIVYPVARALPILLVAVVSSLILQKLAGGLGLFAGGLLIIAGAIILPRQNGKRFKLHDLKNRTLWFAFLAAVGTTGYSLVDDAALRLLRNGLNSGGIVQVTLVYACLEGLLTALWLAVIISFTKKSRSETRDVLQSQKGPALITGLGIFLTYSLVLIAMSYAQNVSYVVAFRQLSIPIGAMLGMIILHEARYLNKFIGITAIFGGAILVALF